MAQYTTELYTSEQKYTTGTGTDKPLISVIVPVYNIIEYLPRCVASICDQTYDNLEILLVDDGSTDGTGQLCDELAAQDARIRVFHKVNGGSSSARNLGITHAKGAFFGFVDSDDYIEPDMYERLAAVLGVQNELILRQDLSVKKELHMQPDGQDELSMQPDGQHVQSHIKCMIAQIGRDEVAENGERLSDICLPPEKLIHYSAEEFLRELLMHRGDCSFCTKLVARELFEAEQFPVGVLNEDFHLLVGMLNRAGGVWSLPGYGYHVFYRIGSNTRKKDKEAFSRVYSDNVDNADMVLALTREQYPALVRVAERFGLFQRLDYLLHIPISQMTRDNTAYRQVVGNVRRNFIKMLVNPYLTVKNKLYLAMFTIAPKGIRTLHARMKGL